MTTTLCPRCGAPIPWDGQSKTVHCPYCQIVVTPSAYGAPRPPMPGMGAPRASGGAAGCLIAAVVVGVVALFGGIGFWFMLRAKS